jgi:hypothetical protein
MTAKDAALPSALLDDMQYEADPLADAAIARILGAWAPVARCASPREAVDAQAPRWQRLAIVSGLLEQWTDNRSIEQWDPADAPRDIVEPLQAYLAAARVLPPWADPAKIARAETLFMEHGVLSCTLLFCASLPECYVVPALAEVLHTTGQLEQRAEYRIRSTAAMIFPVMMSGGLTQPDGAGLAQVLKVRLIHATIRQLILRKSPEEALAALGARHHLSGAEVVEPLPAECARGMHQALYARGWNLGRDGLPCNQEELAYTLLTFGYVFLRGLRTLGVPFTPSDEEAYLHAWNVAGHAIGVQRGLMADTMDEAGALFERLQARGRARPVEPDPRDELAGALMQVMRRAIPLRLAKPFPVLLTRRLCGRRSSRDLGLTRRVPLVSRALFAALMAAIRAIDAAVRRFVPQFSISRFVTRLVGYQLLTRLLMDETLPLKLPEHLLRRVNRTMADWGTDRTAPRWLNRLEDRFTAPGAWTPRPR